MSEGFCEVDFSDASDDAEQVQFFDEKTVKARKVHKCSECDGPIAVGEAHRRVAYKFEGDFRTERQCAPCREAAGEFGLSILGGILWETFHAEWDEGKHLQPCLNRLASVRAKEHMRQQWVKWHDLRARQRQAAIERRKPSNSTALTDS